mmetsp:Transcript_28740/g.54028  ORF Transcript_28740/g.54028 Transcript_28740/m.54028 type:complete len:108 (+) Transcript_28740:726-1049(+)
MSRSRLNHLGCLRQETMLSLSIGPMVIDPCILTDKSKPCFRTKEGIKNKKQSLARSKGIYNKPRKRMHDTVESIVTDISSSSTAPASVEYVTPTILPIQPLCLIVIH